MNTFKIFKSAWTDGTVLALLQHGVQYLFPNSAIYLESTWFKDTLLRPGGRLK
jgi:hypothetical protein